MIAVQPKAQGVFWNQVMIDLQQPGVFIGPSEVEASIGTGKDSSTELLDPLITAEVVGAISDQRAAG